ncbi:MAG: DegT/DnrJ/EryC1/StrS family aminotransferase, partial [Bdellovibrionia bacterium]
GQHVGTFGHGGTLSHFYSHHLTTMEGGMILTNDPKLSDDLRSLRAHGWLRDRTDKQVLAQANPDLDPRFLFVMPGYNVRPLEVEAAIGLVQLGRMDGFLAKREKVAGFALELAERYTPWMKMIGGEFARKPALDRRKRTHSWMNLPFVVERGGPTVKEVKESLEECGVETRPIIAGNLTKHPACKNIKMRAAASSPNSDHILNNGFMIGCNPTASEKALSTLETAFRKFSK